MLASVFFRRLDGCNMRMGAQRSFGLGHNLFQGYGDACVTLASCERIATTDGWVALGRFASHILGDIGMNGQGKMVVVLLSHLLRFGVLCRLVNLISQPLGLGRRSLSTHIHFALGWGTCTHGREALVDFLQEARQY
jgi:hypothetical protein